jgi:hypothetical protein
MCSLLGKPSPGVEPDVSSPLPRIAKRQGEQCQGLLLVQVEGLALQQVYFYSQGCLIPPPSPSLLYNLHE